MKTTEAPLRSIRDAHEPVTGPNSAVTESYPEYSENRVLISDQRKKKKKKAFRFLWNSAKWNFIPITRKHIGTAKVKVTDLNHWLVRGAQIGNAQRAQPHCFKDSSSLRRGGAAGWNLKPSMWFFSQFLPVSYLFKLICSFCLSQRLVITQSNA